MKYNIEIGFTEFESLAVTKSIFDENTIDVCLYAKPDTDLRKELNIDTIKENVKGQLKTYSDMFIDEIDITAMKYVVEHDDDILSLAETVFLDPDDDLDEFIEKNKEVLSDKKLIIARQFGVNDKDLNEITEKYSKYKNMYFKIDGNEEITSISDYKKTVEAIDNMVNKIKKYNLSPLEQIMFAYDLVRERVYSKELESDKYSTSRDLTSVLLGDKIVCVGYANIFGKILNNLDINNQMITIIDKENKDMGHMRNIVHVVDEKYNLDGVYFFDPTWDSRRINDTTNSYLKSYRFFCKNKPEMDYLSKNYIDHSLLNLEEDLFYRIDELMEFKEIEKINKEDYLTINRICTFLTGESFVSPFQIRKLPGIPETEMKPFDYDEKGELLEDIREKVFDFTLNESDLLEALINVRKVEYYDEPEKYPYSLDSIKSSIVEYREVTEKEKLLRAVFGIPKVDKKVTEEEFNSFAESRNLEKEIETVKLAKALRLTLDKKLKN